ncbi:hypothetical protein VitviT2T_002086 [Vitis vinifera]|uniref:MINDY deubiquitinase domain-containing protein n=1 Tax=Vitis vinifera TaxID=29760 RepID=A0ABY9BHF3_VITVI|nr:uncharacterized protein LOC100263264 isoform X1 [Vitis vinifera]WJZ82317.1 hypothetical protein VitviT2T_002086 [Vitis vinifera]|eukprot:XP_002275737.1 PREDICTED: ubiquitin carboxyl-terminal hydrolase MINDY-2 isoform X1 [Vitis vinifera]
MASEEQQQPQRREEPADECLHKTKVVQFLGRTTPIILQNENGPCPLLAICNVLLLKNNLNLSPDIAEVSQQKLLSLVAERLIDSNSNINNKDAGYVENQQQNISDAIDLLPCLATGIDVNIKFRRIGDFEFTRECAIFDLLDIPLYHGWIVDPQDSETANAIGSKSYNALVGELVALDSRNMEGEPKSTPEEDCIDFAAATTATLGVPSPSLSRARSFEDSPHSISDNQTVRKGDLQEEAELSRILKLSEAELSTTVDDSLIVNAIGGISIHSDSVVVNTNGEISVSSGASSYPNKCMPVPLVETLEVHTGGTDQNFHQQEAAISDDYNALSRDENNLPSSQTTPAEGVCSLSNTDGGSHINQPASEESRMHFPSDDVVDKTNGENLVQNENAPSPSTRRDPISADESSVVILGGDEKIQKQFTSTANVHEQTDNQSACGTTEASGLSTTNTDLSGGRRLNVVVSADFTPSVDDGEPIYEGEECILDSNTTIYEDREPMYEGEVVLAEQADKDSVDSCNIGFKDELTPLQGELVRNFLKNNANQLTVYGLFCLRDNLKERELCVFFRNNHFSTMFKLDGDLYLLATDQGYINQPDLVWEKLNEVNGDSVFMTSNFKEFKVESHSSGTWDEQNAMASTADYLASIDNSAQGASDLNSDLQLAIALQQQEFEQQPQRQNMQQPSSSGNSRLITGPQAPRTSGRNSSSARHDAKSSKEKCIVM